MTSQIGFYFDGSACTSCKACQVACQDKNNLPAAISFRHVYQYGGGGWVPDDRAPGSYRPNNVYSYSISAACMHCEKAICTEVCPTAAITKDENGVVLIDAEKCIGCRYCEWACPYGAPQFREDLGVMTKCDFCVDLQAQGQNPACVDACVMRALEFGEVEELRAKYGSEAAIEPLPSPELTHPSLVIKPHRHAQASGQGTGRILSLPEEG